MERTWSEDEVTARLARELPHWRLSGGHICRVYRTHGWKASLMVVNAIGHLAEATFHHPDITLSYDRVEVRLMTHSAAGVTDKDFALAARIEALIQWQPGREGGALEGPRGDAAGAYIKYDQESGPR
ncbi:MAG: 4a-hydroxytetrahydrobiopterin dehydratase [Alphaproteobacteria bacterium]|nr:MAG: 4a-hydroxytetrahydrobiopterin dehydratase [Alphaproteobacteria bacterium]